MEQFPLGMIFLAAHKPFLLCWKVNASRHKVSVFAQYADLHSFIVCWKRLSRLEAKTTKLKVIKN